VWYNQEHFFSKKSFSKKINNASRDDMQSVSLPKCYPNFHAKLLITTAFDPLHNAGANNVPLPQQL